MDFNNNFFNPNINSYFTPTLFDSNNSNLALHNKDKSNKPDWMYSTQYNPYLQSYNKKLKNNFNSSQSQWGFTSLVSNFQPLCPQFSQYSFPNFTSCTPFPEPPIEEKYDIEKRMKAEEGMLESQQQFQNKLDSQSSRSHIMLHILLFYNN